MLVYQLPLRFRDAGFTVWGVDVSQKQLHYLSQENNPVLMWMTSFQNLGQKDGISEPQLRKLSRIVANGDATVPTPITHDLKPDLGDIEDAGRAF